VPDLSAFVAATEAAVRELAGAYGVETPGPAEGLRSPVSRGEGAPMSPMRVAG